MKKTITFSAFCDAFHSAGREDQFSYDAKRALFDFMEEAFPDYDLDVIGLCCEYAEASWYEIAKDYDLDLSEADGDEDEEQAIVEEFLQENTCIVGSLKQGVYVYAQF